MKSALFIVSLLGGVSLAFSGHAQENKPVPRADVTAEQRLSMDVLSRIYADLDDLVGVGKPLEPHMLFRLMLVAKQKAAAETCDGFEVDDVRYTMVMEKALANVSAYGEGTDDAFLRIMMSFASGYGAELALAALNPQAYCTYAAELREEFKEDAAGEVIVWKDPA